MQIRFSTTVTGSITKIIVQNNALAFALHSGGYVLRFDGMTWDPLVGTPTEPIGALEIDSEASPVVVYISTDSKVYASNNNGNNWIDVSNGLPMRCHCGDLKFIQYPDGTRYMYLGTYGRSVWRARLDEPKSSPLDLSKYVTGPVSVLVGVTGDGGGIVITPNGVIVRIPPDGSQILYGLKSLVA